MKKLAIYLTIVTIGILLTACVPGPDFVVDSGADDVDANMGNGVCKTANNECTLRAAIMESNYNYDTNRITFSGVSLIQPAAPLPAITAGHVHILGNGDTVLDGSILNESGNSGLTIEGSSFNTIQGLQIRNFFYGIYIDGSNGTATQNTIGLSAGETSTSSPMNTIILNQVGIAIYGQEASHNTVAGNHIGISPSGAESQPNELSGISIGLGAHENTIGSLTSNQVNMGANLISGNNGVGVHITGGESNHVTGNLIGTNIGGENPLPNGEGIRITTSNNNIIGIAPSGEGYQNLISGNLYNAITLGEADDTVIAGNLIGSNINGTSAVPNRHGVYIMDDCSSNTIGTNGDGTSDAQEGNLISGNIQQGVRISGNTSIHNVIAGNLIGTDLAGTSALGNGGGGIYISGDMNLIGTNGDGISDSLEGNVISGNDNTGILLNAFAARVSGNLIGVDITGLQPLGNGYHGIFINSSSHDNIIGTNGDGSSDELERNIISDNGWGTTATAGIQVMGVDNIIAGNFIGVDSNGAVGIGNVKDGISLTTTATGNLIGTDGDGLADELEGNLISGNGRHGINLTGAYINRVAGNRIGTDITGTLSIPNGHSSIGALGAVQLSSGASGNTIGTNSDGSGDSAEGNLISGNSVRGVIITGATTHFNIIAGNFIGTDSSGTAALGNNVGLEIMADSYLNQIGTNGDGSSDIWERNIISGNSGPGVAVQGSDNTIAGNYIGTDVSGAGDLGNSTYGIYMIDNSSHNTIGGSTQETNTIAFNGKDGVAIFGDNSTGNLISANSIFDNDEYGIDLADPNQTWLISNDPGDADSGPNDLLNFPDLSQASSIGTQVAITGEISNGLPSTQFTLEFFSNPACDTPSNHGEGKNYLGSSIETTDPNGDVSFLVSLPAIVPPGTFITATATTDNKTSEFSNCVELADAQTYMEKADEEEFPCDEFIHEQMAVTSSFVNTDTGLLTLYIKNSRPYPQPEPEAEWGYSAVLGDITSQKCNFQGFEDRLYCSFIVPEELHNTAQQLQVFSSLCSPPIYSSQVSIFVREDPEPTEELDVCHSGLDDSACTAAGGSIEECGLACTCICP